MHTVEEAINGSYEKPDFKRLLTQKETRNYLVWYPG